jgi:hypothetical protein
MCTFSLYFASGPSGRRALLRHSSCPVPHLSTATHPAAAPPLIAGLQRGEPRCRLWFDPLNPRRSSVEVISQLPCQFDDETLTHGFFSREKHGRSRTRTWMNHTNTRRFIFSLLHYIIWLVKNQIGLWSVA